MVRAVTGDHAVPTAKGAGRPRAGRGMLVSLCDKLGSSRTMYSALLAWERENPNPAGRACAVEAVAAKVSRVLAVAAWVPSLYIRCMMQYVQSFSRIQFNFEPPPWPGVTSRR